MFYDRHFKKPSVRSSIIYFGKYSLVSNSIVIVSNLFGQTLFFIQQSLCNKIKKSKKAVRHHSISCTLYMNMNMYMYMTHVHCTFPCIDLNNKLERCVHYETPCTLCTYRVSLQKTNSIAHKAHKFRSALISK